MYSHNRQKPPESSTDFVTHKDFLILLLNIFALMLVIFLVLIYFLEQIRILDFSRNFVEYRTSKYNRDIFNLLLVLRLCTIKNGKSQPMSAAFT